MRYAAPPYWPDQKPYKPRITWVIAGDTATTLVFTAQGYITAAAPMNWKAFQ